MTTEIQLTSELIASVAGKLDAVSDQFTDEERATLLAVFGIASQTIEDASPDVEGFAFTGGGVPVRFNPGGLPPLGGGFKNTFNPGIGRPGPGSVQDIAVGGSTVTWTA